MSKDKQSFQSEGIMEKGYGFIPKLIMKDKELTIEAKAIYAYLSSYTGAGNTAYPSISLMCGDLDISEARFYKHRKLLVSKGYIIIDKKRNEGGWSNNIYKLPFKPYPQNLSTQNLSTQNLSTQNLSTQNEGTKSNSLKSNSLKSNSIKSNTTTTNTELVASISKIGDIVDKFQGNGFGLINLYTSERLIELSETYTEDWLMEALDIAIDNNKRNIGYTEAILKRWQTEGKSNIKKQVKKYNQDTSNPYIPRNR